MTLYFLQPSGSYTDAISFTVNTPNITGDCQLILTSDYSKKEIMIDIVVAETNDRYTEFTMDYTDTLGDGDYSGFYQYEINNGSVVESGLLKFVNNKDQSVENQPKHISPNENGSSYVIY